MFSQISAKLRFSSVPSPESEFTRSYTFEASWSRALRTCMGGLLLRSGKAGDACRSRCKRFAHAFPRRAADDVVTIERWIQFNGGEKVAVELASELAQLIKRKIAEFDALFERKPDCVADLFVRGPKGHTLVHEVRCRSHGIQVSRLRCTAHALEVKREGGGEARYQQEHLRDKIDRKYRFLGLLHVLVVGQGQSLQLQRDGLGRAVNSPHFRAQQLGEIWILFLRHGARSG